MILISHFFSSPTISLVMKYKLVDFWEWVYSTVLHVWLLCQCFSVISLLSRKVTLARSQGPNYQDWLTEVQVTSDPVSGLCICFHWGEAVHRWAKSIIAFWSWQRPSMETNMPLWGAEYLPILLKSFAVTNLGFSAWVLRLPGLGNSAVWSCLNIWGGLALPFVYHWHSAPGFLSWNNQRLLLTPRVPKERGKHHS